jgi:hypothetical protein
MPQPACQVTPVTVIILPPAPTPRQVMSHQSVRSSDLHDAAYDRRTFVKYEPEVARYFEPDPYGDH